MDWLLLVLLLCILIFSVATWFYTCWVWLSVRSLNEKLTLLGAFH